MTEEQGDFIEQLLSHGPSQGTLILAFKKMKKEGRFHDAIKNCLTALHSYPDDIRLRTLLAESYLEGGFIGQAETEFEKIASQISSLVSVFKLQSELYMRQKKYDKACDALRIYLAHNPDDEEVTTLLAAIERPEEEWIDEISGVVEDAVSIDEISEVVEDVVLIDEISEVVEDVVLIDEISEVVEDVVSDETEILEGSEWAESHDAGQREEEIIVDASSELETPTLAEIYFNQGQISEAINTYEVVLSINPDDHASSKRLAELKRLAKPRFWCHGFVADK